MTPIKPEDVKLGEYLLITATTSSWIGLVGRMATIKAVDWPFAVIVTELEFSGASRQVIQLPEFSFAVPSDVFISELEVEAEWPEEMPNA